MNVQGCCIAASAALACQLACAQSGPAAATVQIYGIVDAGVAYADKVRTGGGGSPTGSTVHVDTGNASNSRIGFKGREDLGGGLSAVFLLEQGFNSDAGTLAQGGRAWGRGSYVGLNGPYGEIQLGREITATFEFALMFDPVAPTRFSTPVFDLAYVGWADNAIKYIGNFGKFNVRTQYSMGYDSLVANGGELAQSKVGREMGLEADYAIGRLTFGGSADRQNGQSVATQDDKNVRLNVGATYDLDGVKLYAAYQRQNVTTAGVSAVNKFYWVGAKSRLSERVSMAAGLYVYDPAGASNRTTMPTVVGFYQLSPRTDLYSQIGHLTNQSAASRAMIGAVNPGDSQTAFTVGIRHRF